MNGQTLNDRNKRCSCAVFPLVLYFLEEKKKIHRPASGINFKLDIKHQERARHAPLVSVQTEGICGIKALMWLNSYWIKTNKVEVKPHYSAF